ncbi:FapA family protein [Thermoclostridium caenicola]|uniref:Flagellar Assembly Protein A N-terminal region domain-containing protein n=1 Tax=Thermoclostridium caenicola TaxID=659425 RepID=A0A1M6CVQ4_9FIRM|nr:FapA family protein [Thermoclostridium caenicola]SHI65040.1 hypothetical protein SAMN05444373_10061 [Thermoclostridium caenicola]
MALLLFKNEYIEISRDAGYFYIKSTAKGLSMEAFSKILQNSFPQIKIISFTAIKNALLNAPHGPVLFGQERDRVIIHVSNDELRAYMTLYVPDKDLAPENRDNLIREIYEALRKAGVVYGIKTEVLTGSLSPSVEYLIAEGVPAINGTDAEIKLYEIQTPKPQVYDSGNVNHYELNLIHRVNKGDWLGERKNPTPGIPGKSVRGNPIPPIPGKWLPLLYDRTSVYEETKDGVTTLYAKKTGAVYYKGDTIGVYDFLEINGDIDFSTGNIGFDGYLSVKGTVEDNFCAVSDKDLEILGEYGVGAADQIGSRDGNVYIRGGIAGKGKTVLRCKKNLYVKFLSDITVECEGNVYVGFYCINANIKARQVIVEAPRGKIIGGTIDAEIRVSAADIGNVAENRTVIRVRGFNRSNLKMELDQKKLHLKELRDQLTQLKQHIHVYSCSSDLSEEQRIQFEELKNQYSDLKEQIKELEYELRNLTDDLKTPGEGAVIVRNRCYPRVRVEIKGIGEEITKETPMTVFYFKDNAIKTR